MYMLENIKFHGGEGEGRGGAGDYAFVGALTAARFLTCLVNVPGILSFVCWRVALLNVKPPNPAGEHSVGLNGERECSRKSNGCVCSTGRLVAIGGREYISLVEEGTYCERTLYF